MLHTDSIDGGKRPLYTPGHVTGEGRPSNSFSVLMNILLKNNMSWKFFLIYPRLVQDLDRFWRDKKAPKSLFLKASLSLYNWRFWLKWWKKVALDNIFYRNSKKKFFSVNSTRRIKRSTGVLPLHLILIGLLLSSSFDF
jgi:hypothetical protein